MFKKFVVAGAVAVLAVLGLSAPASAAAPAAPPAHFVMSNKLVDPATLLAPKPKSGPLALSDCPGGIACVWTDRAYSGSRMNIPVGIYGTNICYNFVSPFINTISSSTNDYGTALGLYLYDAQGCSILHGYWEDTWDTSTYDYNGSGFNDNFESFMISYN